MWLVLCPHMLGIRLSRLKAASCKQLISCWRVFVLALGAHSATKSSWKGKESMPEAAFIQWKTESWWINTPALWIPCVIHLWVVPLHIPCSCPQWSFVSDTPCGFLPFHVLLLHFPTHFSWAYPGKHRHANPCFKVCSWESKLWLPFMTSFQWTCCIWTFLLIHTNFSRAESAKYSSWVQIQPLTSSA